MSKEFVQQLERKFPWASMETEVSPEIFKDEYVFTGEFWNSISEVLAPHYDEERERCFSILDFVRESVAREFANKLDRKFPWIDMKTQVSPEIFKCDYVHTAEFWNGIDKALWSYRQDDSLRCIEVVDFIGRCVNQTYGEATLAHCKNLQFAILMLKYMRESLIYKELWPAMNALILLHIVWVAKHCDFSPEEREDLLERCNLVQLKLYPDRLFVGDRDEILQYVSNDGYSYVWSKDGTFAKFLRENKLISA